MFTATYSDALGYTDIGYALFMVAGNTSGAAGCFAMWMPGGNAFYLGNDAATAWLGPIQGGSGATVQNSQCVPNGATSSGSGSGNTLTVHFSLSFGSGLYGSEEHLPASDRECGEYGLAAGRDVEPIASSPVTQCSAFMAALCQDIGHSDNGL